MEEKNPRKVQSTSHLRDL